MMQIHEFLPSLIGDHARYAWDREASDLLAQLPLSCVDVCEAGEVASGLCVPIGIPFDVTSRPVSVDCCGGVNLPQLDLLDPAAFPDFETLGEFEWLWKNAQGAYMLAFNLAGFIERFVCFGEEREIADRDEHDRLPFDVSTLGKLGVLHEPILNKYLFAVLAVAKGHAVGQPAVDPVKHVLPPVLVLSHDCDQLRGNDFITQAVRVHRFLAPPRRMRLPKYSNIRYVIENLLRPRKYYFDDALAMSDVEHQFGFRSVFYFLNGIGGRYGARSGSAIIEDFAGCLRSSSELGIHYNYRYGLDRDQLAEQMAELESLIGRSVAGGRAHYLIVEPVKSFAILESLGICSDESIGFAQENSFRLGFAGAFRTWHGLPRGRSPVVEIPMHFMDANTVAREDDFDLYGMVSEVEKVGGLITLLFHPGMFNSPEAATLRGRYVAHLSYFHKKGYRSMLPSEIVALLDPELLTW
jgi:hypothetical protein